MNHNKTTTRQAGWSTGVASVLLPMVLAACASTAVERSAVGEGGQPVAVERTSGVVSRALDRESGTATGQAGGGAATHSRGNEFIEGSGRFINARAARGSVVQTHAGDYTLKFENTELREVAKSILGDLLDASYTVDSKLAGSTVYMQTGTPLAKEDLLPALETLLSRYGALIVYEGGIYNIVPEAAGLESVLAPSTTLSKQRGYQNIIVALHYIAAEEMRKLLESIHKVKKGIAIDEHRNLLLVSGTQTELRELLRTVEIFDVDQMQGMSVALFRLETVEAKAIKKELETILDALAGESGARMVRILEIERINSLLAISPQRKYLKDIEEWIARLDHAELSAGRGMYVYFVQNGDATKMADVLQRLISGGSGTAGARRVSLGVPATRAREPAAATQNGGVASGAAAAAAAAAAGTVPRAPLRAVLTSAQGGDGGVANVVSLSEVSIIADEERNALVVLATPEEYGQVEKALRKLDVAPNQVLVQASIIEVTLSDELNFGLEWYFRNGRGTKTGTGQLDLGGSGIAPVVPGFSYSIVDSADKIALALNTLASNTKLNVISSPSLMVLDNRTATITVGDQVPIRTSETINQATAGDNPVITSSIQFRDTGVTLEVTPRVNNGGKVIMDIRQEVSSVDRTTTSSIDSPTINQREIKTSVAVQSGDTIVLGGLIQDDNQNSESGVPGIRRVPIIGWFFGSESKSKTRTELLVLITPTAILDDSDAREATKELKLKMKGLQQISLEH